MSEPWFIAYKPLPWWRRVWLRLTRRRNRRGWTEVGCTTDPPENEE